MNCPHVFRMRKLTLSLICSTQMLTTAHGNNHRNTQPGKITTNPTWPTAEDSLLKLPHSGADFPKPEMSLGLTSTCTPGSALLGVHIFRLLLRAAPVGCVHRQMKEEMDGFSNYFQTPVSGIIKTDLLRASSFRSRF